MRKNKYSGFSIAEIVVAVAILGIIALGIAFFTTSSKKASTQVHDSSECTAVAVSAIETFKTLGGQSLSHPPFVPDSNQTDRFGTTLNESIPASLRKAVPIWFDSRWATPIIGSAPASGEYIKINSSLLLMNPVNGAQALYNSNPTGFCKNNEEDLGVEMPSLLPESTSLKNPLIYLKIIPFDLTKNTDIICDGTTKISAPISSTLSIDPTKSLYQIGGNSQLGFRIVASVLHETSNSTKVHCQSATVLTHSRDDRNVSPSPSLTQLMNLAGAELFPSTGSFGTAYTSCNPSVGFDSIRLTYQFSGIEDGSVIVCRSYEKPSSACASCTYPTATVWHPCDQFRFAGQTGVTQSEWRGSDKTLTLTFNNLTHNSRFPLEIASIDSGGNLSASSRILLLVDSSRPSVNVDLAPDEKDVGRPGDGQASRLPIGYYANWLTPVVQCNTEKVSVIGTYSGSLEENWIKPLCKSRLHISECLWNDINKSVRATTLDPATHGRHQIDIYAVDVCNANTTPGSYPWPTVLNFNVPATIGPFTWANDKSKTTPPWYEFEVPPPAASPQHFIVRCDCNQTVFQDRDNKCGALQNIAPNGCYSKSPGSYDFDYQVIDICGRRGSGGGDYNVTGAVGDRCMQNRCNSGLSCCDGSTSATTCMGGHCYSTDLQPRDCSPKITGCNYIGCPEPGLMECCYQSRCEPSSTEGLATDCPINKQTGDPCEFSARGTCLGNNCVAGSFSGPPLSGLGAVCSSTASPSTEGLTCYFTKTGACGSMIPSSNGCTPRGPGPLNPSGSGDPICVRRPLDCSVPVTPAPTPVVIEPPPPSSPTPTPSPSPSPTPNPTPSPSPAGSPSPSPIPSPSPSPGCGTQSPMVSYCEESCLANGHMNHECRLVETDMRSLLGVCCVSGNISCNQQYIGSLPPDCATESRLQKTNPNWVIDFSILPKANALCNCHANGAWYKMTCTCNP